MDALGFYISRYVKNLNDLAVDIEVKQALYQFKLKEFTAYLERIKAEEQSVIYKSDPSGFKYHWIVYRKLTNTNAYLRYID